MVLGLDYFFPLSFQPHAPQKYKSVIPATLTSKMEHFKKSNLVLQNITGTQKISLGNFRNLLCELTCDWS